jgi:hypothetical protein
MNWENMVRDLMQGFATSVARKLSYGKKAKKSPHSWAHSFLWFDKIIYSTYEEISKDPFYRVF